ncbi:MAG: AI-2E family transporter [Alphaproteobacteria bacterium]
MQGNSTQQPKFYLGVIFLGLFLFALYYIRSVIFPFASAMIIAYFLAPFVALLERHKVKRGLGTFLAFALVALIAALIVLFIYPVFKTQMASLMKYFPVLFEAVLDKLKPLFDSIENKIQDHYFDPMKAALSAGNYLSSAIKWIVNILSGFISGSMFFVNIISFVTITPFVAFYFIRDWNKIISKLNGFVPVKYRKDIQIVFKDIDNILSGYIKGQAYVCLAMAVYYALALSLAGLDVGLVVGLVSGVFTFIPFVGPFVGFALAVSFAVIQFSSFINIVVVIVLFGIGQILEGNFLTPNLVGDKTKLHPVWIVFAVMTGGACLGLLGVLISIPVAATVGVVVRYLIDNYYKSNFYLEES